MEQLIKYLFVFSILTTSVTGETSDGALRLVRNNQYSTIQAWSSGIVEIYYDDDDVWGNICDDSYFGYNEANVICHQLAFTGASSYGNSGDITIYGTDINSMLIEDVSCSNSNYLVLLQCSVSDQYSSECNNHEKDVVVTCYSTRIWDNPYSGQIRLTGGTYSNEGLLEVYCNEQWGTVCDDTFSFNDAYVACKQLGYNDYNHYDHLAITGSSQPIWFDDVHCSIGTYNCLTTCQSCPSVQDHNCDHTEDVTLDCETSSWRSDVVITGDTCDFSGPDTTTAVTTTSTFIDTSSSRASTATSTSTTSATSSSIKSTISTTTSNAITSTVTPTDEPVSYVIVGAGIGSGILLVTVIIGIAVCVCCFFGCKKGSNKVIRSLQKCNLQICKCNRQVNILHYKLPHLLLTHIMFKIQLPHILQTKELCTLHTILKNTINSFTLHK